MPEAALHDWLVPDWPAPAGVQAVCTTRSGGVSAPPYASLNLGDHVGDAPAHVATNRAIFQRAIGARPVFLQQVHGTQVLTLDAGTADASMADACVTRAPGVACTVMVADCLPVLLTTTRGDCVAAAHAGWRGLAGSDGVGVLESTFKEFCTLAHIDQGRVATDIMAWLGPCIGPTAFEVGDEVRQAFVAGSSSGQGQIRHREAVGRGDPGLAGGMDCFAALAMTDGGRQDRAGKWLADLAGLARLRLRALGVEQIYGNDSSAAWCTVGNASRFFSHRRDRVSGRFAASIWLRV